MNRLSLRSALTPLLVLASFVPAGAQPFWEHLEFIPDVNVRSIAVSPDGQVYVATTGNGVYRSVDNGDFWESRSNGLSTVSADGIAIGSDGMLYLASYATGVFRSSDNGESWVLKASGITDVFVRAIAVTGDGRLFVGSEDEGIFMSTDLGESWSNVGGATTREEVYTIHPVSDEIVLAGIKYFGICRTIDAGSTWTRIGNFVSPRSIVATVDAELVAACYGNGVQYSANGGSSWQARSTGLGTTDVTLVHHFGGHLLAATSDNAIYRSSDRGLTWAAVADGLGGRIPQAFATLPNGRLLVGTESGLFRSVEVPLGVAATPSVGEPRLVVDRAARVLRVGGPNRSGGVLSLHDVLGRRIASVDGSAGRGCAIDLSRVPPGRYFAHAVVGDAVLVGMIVVDE